LSISDSMLQQNRVQCPGLYCPVTTGGAILVTGTMTASVVNNRFNNNYGWIGSNVAAINAPLLVQGNVMTSSGGAYGAAAASDGAAVTITANLMRDMGNGQNGTALFLLNGSSAEIAGNTIERSEAWESPIWVNTGRILFVNNAVRGLKTDSPFENARTLIRLIAPEVSVLHNTFVENTGVHTETILLRSIGDVFTFTNNIVVSSTVGVESNSTNAALANNLYFEVARPVSGTITSNSGALSADPQFVLRPSNLHLGSGSPARNAGAAGSGVVSDIDGQTRDAQPDIGADEFVAMQARAYLPMARRP
jgi:hypothetical protein